MSVIVTAIHVFLDICRLCTLIWSLPVFWCFTQIKNFENSHLGRALARGRALSRTPWCELEPEKLQKQK